MVGEDEKVWKQLKEFFEIDKECVTAGKTPGRSIGSDKVTGKDKADDEAAH